MIPKSGHRFSEQIMRKEPPCPFYAVIGKRAGCRGITGCDPVERSEIRERRCSNAVLADAQLFEAVDGDNIKFRVFLFRRIAPAFQRLHAFPAKDHDRPVR